MPFEKNMKKMKTKQDYKNLRTKMNIPDIKNVLKEGLVVKIFINDIRQKHSILYKTRDCFWRIMIYYYKLRITISEGSCPFYIAHVYELNQK